MRNISVWILVSMLTVVSTVSLQAEEDHGHDHDEQEVQQGQDQHEEHAEEEQAVHLSPQQRAAAEIKTTVLQARAINTVLQAPGEVTLNEYATSKVTPRISAEIIIRHAKLGDEVSQGQALVTLSSVDMAQAQGDLLVAEREWQRVRQLGRKVVSESRYTQARVTREQARSKVLAYGMSHDQLNELVSSGKADQANGEFQLVAPQKGTVIRDHFILGELVEPGTVLFEISDESVLWVEARLTPEQAAQVNTNTAVTIEYRATNFEGKVTQVHHALDESTRTLGVRIAVDNPDDALHPGLFVNTSIETQQDEQALAVPVNAVLRSPDGDWLVFVEHEDNEFEPQEVTLVRTSGGLAVIDGISPGTRIVTSGAFFLQSELAKTGFDIHNH